MNVGIVPKLKPFCQSYQSVYGGVELRILQQNIPKQILYCLWIFETVTIPEIKAHENESEQRAGSASE